MKKILTKEGIKKSRVIGFIVWIPPENGENDPEEGEWGLWHINNNDNGYVDYDRGYGPSFWTLPLDENKFGDICKKYIPKIRKLTIPNNLRFKIFKRDEFKCQYCGKGVKEGVILEVDHIIPKSKGGNDTEDNLITSCKECNRGKGKNI